MAGGRPTGSGIEIASPCGRTFWGARPRSAPAMLVGGLIALFLGSSPAQAASNKVRISNLSDVAFGTVANLTVDAVRTQSLCLYADTAANGYNVRASGSGPGGAFALASGSNSLPYDVQWNNASGQSVGTQLSANVALSGQISAASQQTCNTGPATTASLIVILRSTALSSAAAGSYTGSLTLIIGAE